jgi:enterochelin esterase family protein
VWSYRLALPPDAYIEYTFLDRSQTHSAERLVDPFNPHRISNGMGKHNHFFYMPQGQATPLARRAVIKGQVSQHVLESPYLLANGRRTVYLYQPPVEQPVPLLVVWDGRDYLRRARLAVIVERLIAQGRIRPLALAMVEHGRQARMVEYACSEATLGLLHYEVLPLARQHLNLLDLTNHPGAYGVLGASMGGLMALFTGLRMPQIFGHVLSQSGAFALGEYDSLVFDFVNHGDPHALKLWLDVGLYDHQPLLAANRRMQGLMTERGYAFEYHEYSGGHNYTAWRNDVGRGLEYLFG